MDAIEAISQRRAIKHFDPNHRLSEDEIQLLLKIAAESPSFLQYPALADCECDGS